MDNGTYVYLDYQIDKKIRSNKEGDAILHFAGIGNIIFSILKFQKNITEPDNCYSEEKILEMFPVNTKINGFILIYNENTYDDVDEAINTNIEILKKNYSQKLSDKLYILCVKEVLYIDGKLEFDPAIEYTISDESKIDVTCVFSDISEKIKEKYHFLYDHIEFSLNDLEENKDRVVNVNIENYDKFCKTKLSLYFEGEKFFIDDLSNLSDEKLLHISKILSKIKITEPNQVWF